MQTTGHTSLAISLRLIFPILVVASFAFGFRFSPLAHVPIVYARGGDFHRLRDIHKLAFSTDCLSGPRTAGIVRVYAR